MRAFRLIFPLPKIQNFSMNGPLFSTKRIHSELLEKIVEAIKDKTYGSVEIYIQDSQVTQITERVINKLNTNNNLKQDKYKLTDRAS